MRETIIKKNDLKKNTFIGLKLPLVSSGSNFFGSTQTNFEQKKYNLRNLLLTNKGEKLFQPDFGCDLGKIVFENEYDVETVIEEQVQKWEPDVIVNDVVVNKDLDRNKIEIEVYFSVAWNDKKIEKIVVPITLE